MDVSIHHHLKVADEVFYSVAELHRLRPGDEDFSVAEILNQASLMNLKGSARPGFAIHVRQHCVANLPPNPGKYRMLFATGTGRRRLLKVGDVADVGRDGKIFPDERDIPTEFRDLVEWAKNRYGRDDSSQSIFKMLIEAQGSGRRLWADESADEYVRRLRADWP